MCHLRDWAELSQLEAGQTASVDHSRRPLPPHTQKVTICYSLANSVRAVMRLSIGGCGGVLQGMAMSSHPY